jgi:hypothetical protein
MSTSFSGDRIALRAKLPCRNVSFASNSRSGFAQLLMSFLRSSSLLTVEGDGAVEINTIPNTRGRANDRCAPTPRRDLQSRLEEAGAAATASLCGDQGKGNEARHVT